MTQSVTATPSRRWGATGLLAALLLAGCGDGDLTPHAYDYAQALYSICNRRDTARLEEFLRLLDQDVQSGEVPQREADWLREIAAQARQGEWTAAQAAARQLLEDQVRHP